MLGSLKDWFKMNQELDGFEHWKNKDGSGMVY